MVSGVMPIPHQAATGVAHVAHASVLVDFDDNGIVALGECNAVGHLSALLSSHWNRPGRRACASV